MSTADPATWHPLHIPPGELRCDVTLTNGQCFGWHKHPTLPEWTGVIDDCVLSLRQTPSDTLYRVLHPPLYPPPLMATRLRDYFHLDRVSLSSLYSDWSRDRLFAAVGPRFKGMRLLRQQPVECLFSFICSSANNIPRITAMLKTLRTHYGDHLITLPSPDPTPSPTDPAPTPLVFHAFPSLERIQQIDPLELRAHGFGYRADYFINTALQLHSLGGLPYLHSLRSPSLPTGDVYSALMDLPGVGPKVAACVALFSLDRLDLIPVDTHVHQIALREYGRELSAGVRASKGVTKRVHEEVGQLFRGKFGEYAGWAHSVLFTAELPAFRHRLQGKVAEGEGEEKERQEGAEDVRVVKVEEVVQEVDVKVGSPTAARKRKGRGGKENVEAEAPEVAPSPRRRTTSVVSSTTTTATITSTSTSTPTSTSPVKVEVISEEVKEVKVEVSPTALANSTLQFPVTKHPRLRIPKKAGAVFLRRSAPMTAG